MAVAAAGDWPAERAVTSVTLDYDDRHRRRIVLTADDGARVLLDLVRAAVLTDGCGLALDGGGWILVRAAAEAVIDVRGHDPAATARLAWHLGNRHAPVQVLAEVLAGLGAEIRRCRAPFTAESGAYAVGHHEGHDDAD